MSALAASCFNRAVLLTQESRLPQAVAYFEAARRFSADGVVEAQLPAVRAALAQAVNHSVSEARTVEAVHMSGFLAMFDPSYRSEISREAGQLRATAHLQAAAASDELDESCAHILAAENLEPQSPACVSLRAALADRLMHRAEGAATESSLQSCALAVLMSNSDDDRLALARDLLRQGDYALIARLCAEIQTRAIPTDSLSLAAQRLGDEATLLAEGKTAEAASFAAAAKTAATLEAQIGANAPNAAQLLARIECRLAMGLLGPALADLRALARLTPGDGWVAKQFCFLLRNIHHPESAISLEIVLRDLPDDAAELRLWLGIALSMGAPAQALRIAERLAIHRPEYSVMSPLHAMATDIYRAPAVVLGTSKPSSRRIYANLTCWGPRYLDLMEEALLASLLAPGNFPALSNRAALTLDIVTMPSDLARVSAMPALRRLGKFCEIRIYLLPDSVGPHAAKMAYTIFGYAAHLTILRAARDGADLLFLVADAVYADGSFEAIGERISEDPVALFADGLNAFASPALGDLATYKRDNVFSVPVSALIRCASSHLTQRSTDNCYRPGNHRNSAAPTRAIFRTATDLRLHSFFKTPVYVSHRAFAPLIQLDFRTTDGLFSEHVLYRLDPSAQLHLPSDRFAFVELCDDDGAVQSLRDEPLEACVQRYFRDYRLCHRRLWLFETPAIFPGDCAPEEFIVHDSEVEERLSGVRRVFETDPQLKDLESERAAIAQLYQADAASDCAGRSAHS